LKVGVHEKLDLSVASHECRMHKFGGDWGVPGALTSPKII